MTASTLEHPIAASHRSRINFAVFAVITAGFGWLCVALDRGTGATTGTGSATATTGTTIGQGLWILVPAVTALALYHLSRDRAGPLGMTLRFAHRTRWFAFAAVLFPAMTVVIVLAGVAVGVATVHAAPSPGRPAGLVAIIEMLPFLLAKNVFEEFIFRGYGTRTAMALGLPGAAPHILVGFVWALWHLPLYVVWMQATDFRVVTSLPWPLFLPGFFLGMIALAVVYGEVRVQTGSIWPVVVLHTISTAIATTLMVNGHLGFAGHYDALFSPVPGAILAMIITGGVGALLLRRRRRAHRAFHQPTRDSDI